MNEFISKDLSPMVSVLFRKVDLKIKEIKKNKDITPYRITLIKFAGNKVFVPIMNNKPKSSGSINKKLKKP